MEVSTPSSSTTIDDYESQGGESLGMTTISRFEADLLPSPVALTYQDANESTSPSTSTSTPTPTPIEGFDIFGECDPKLDFLDPLF